MLLNFSTGELIGESPQSIRRVGDLAESFADAREVDLGQVVYEIHGSPAEVEGPPRLLFATTILHSGAVHGEFFMTRGHFHTRPERGELMLTIKGEGLLLLMDRDGKTWTESMSAGSVHDIDGRHAHRVVNTGGEPLVFFVAWMSDCGHDYQSIADSRFGLRVVQSASGYALQSEN